MEDEEEDDLFEKIKETVEEVIGRQVPFIIILPENQRIATSMDFPQVAPLLSTIVASLLNNHAIIRMHVDEEGNETKDTMN